VVQDFGGEASPARKSGIEPGDIIVAVDGKPVEYVGQLQQQIAFRKAGESVKVEVARKGGIRKTLEVKLEELPARGEAAAADSGDVVDSTDASGAASIDRLGATVAPLDSDDIHQLDLKPEDRGVVVTGVKPGGASWGELADPDHGGPDIILSIEGKPVKTPGDVSRVLRGTKSGDIVSLRVYNSQAKTHRIERIRLDK